MRSLAVLLFVSAVAMLSLYPRGGDLDQTRSHGKYNLCRVVVECRMTEQNRTERLADEPVTGPPPEQQNRTVETDNMEIM